MVAMLLVVAACGSAARDEQTGQARPVSMETSEKYPRTAGMYLGQDAPNWKVLARHDVVIVDMEWAHRAPQALKRIRKNNPRVRILAYVTIEEIVRPATLRQLSDYFRFRKRLGAAIRPDWWLRTAAGKHISLYENTWMLNPTTGWGRHLARFMAKTVMGTGRFDGIYYDNAWASPNWLGNEGIDLDADGRDDREHRGGAWIARSWDAAMSEIFAETKRLAPNAILMGNGSANHYERWGSPFRPPHHRWLNGALDEHWPAYNESWATAQARMQGWLTRARRAPLFVVQSEPKGWKNDPLSDLARFRLAFGTAQINGAHFAYSRGDHQQTWWLDEFGGGKLPRDYLGSPVSGPQTIDGVRLRVFTGGLVAVNPGPVARTIQLPAGPWRHLRGRQDPLTNNGRRVFRLTIPPRDGRVLVRSATTQSG